MSVRWTPERMDRLESAARRGSEYVVVARRLAVVDRKESFVGFLPMTGEELVFALDDIDAFEVIGL